MLAWMIENGGAHAGALLLGEGEGEALKVIATGSAAEVLLLDPPVALADFRRVPPALAEEALWRQQPVVVADPAQDSRYHGWPLEPGDWPKSALCLPVCHQSGLTGLVYLENRAVSGAFSPRHLETLALLAPPMAGAIEAHLARQRQLAEVNRQMQAEVEARRQAEIQLAGSVQRIAYLTKETIRMFELEQQHRTIAQSLQEVAVVLNSSLDQAVVLEKILQYLKRVVDYDSAGVFSIDGDEMVLIAGTELIKHQLGLRLPVEHSKGFVGGGEVLRTRQPIFFGDIRTLPDYDARWKGDTRVRSWMCIPLLTDTEVIGLLTIDNFTSNAYNQSDVRAATAFAVQAAIAFKNARHFSREQRQRQIAESLRQVSAVLNSSLDLGTVLNKLLEQLENVVHYDSAGVFLQEGADLMIVGGAKSGKDFLGFTVPVDSRDPAAVVYQTGSPKLCPMCSKTPIGKCGMTAIIFGPGWGFPCLWPAALLGC